MRTVLITFADKPIKDYPLAVVVLNDTPGCRVPRSQETVVKSVREGWIFANGMCMAAMIIGGDEGKQWPVNPVLDDRLKGVTELEVGRVS